MDDDDKFDIEAPFGLSQQLHSPYNRIPQGN